MHTSEEAIHNDVDMGALIGGQRVHYTLNFNTALEIVI